MSVIPPDIAKLTSLKVLSVRKNLIQELPLCLADMGSLQVLKFEGNPLVFPPKDALPAQASSPPGDNLVRDSDVTEVVVTANIKRFLKQYSLNGRLDLDQAGEETNEVVDTPRAPLKRRVSGRFPIKVNGADPSDARSPNNGRLPPPIPMRSHQRGLSQQNASTRRPGVMPLTLGNANERHRSNSETILRSERSESRNRRMGIVSKKGSDLGTVDEIQANHRFSHYRGLSHGSAMQGAHVEPPTPTESFPQRPIYVRRLSVLPERRRESKVYDPVTETAKGILYSVFQIHPMIQMLLSLSNDGSEKRSSLEIVFYNTTSHVEELEQEISKCDIALLEDDYSSRDNDNVQRACQTLVGAYGHVCTLLAENIDTFVDNGDPRYIRTLLMLIYNSIMELRVTLSSVNAAKARQRPASSDLANGGLTLRPRPRDSSLPRSAKGRAFSRNRSGTVAPPPVNLRVATDMPLPSPQTNGNSRTAIMTSATPRSGESFASISSRDIGSDHSEEDAQFDRIFLSLQKSADIVMRTLPNFQIQLSGMLRNVMQSGAPAPLIREWRALIAMCDNTVQQTEIMRNKLSVIKLKEPGFRSQSNFWTLCNNFILSWTELAYKIKSAMNKLPLPLDTRARLKPIQQSMKDTSAAIVQSPWQHMLQLSAPGGQGSYGTASRPMSPTQTPITPQSAALGPAMQATVPRTPRNDSFAAAFHGNVFDRADALMANPGISMSRPTMPRKGHSNLSSLSSVSSLTSEIGNGPAAMSPGRINGTFRTNGGRSAY